MNNKDQIRVILIAVLLFLLNGNLSNGLVQVSAETMLNLQKMEFYHRAYNQPFSEELLKECIYFEQIQHPEIVLNQARLETGYFKSELFREANNCFGMRLAKVRETTAIGEYNFHAQYSHWTESVKDYKLFQEWYVANGWVIDSEYLVFLKCMGYATDTKYLAKLVNLGDLT